MFGSKSASTDVYVVAWRGAGTPGFEETSTHKQAMAAFRGCLYVIAPETGDYDDPSDPLLIGTAALRAVLAPDEYAALVQAPLAAALLEA